jgi:hypothetical protein
MTEQPNIHTLSDFRKNAEDHLRRLKQSGEPEVLTIDGQAELVVQSAGAYQKLLDAAELSESLPIIRQSLEEARKGLGIPAKEAMRQIGEALGLKDDD